MSWQILLSISIFSLSVSVLLQRILLHKDKTDPIAYAILFEGTAGSLLLITALIHGFSLPDFSAYAIPIAATFFLYALGGILYAKTLKITDASIFSVLFATNTIWVMLGGVLLYNERVGFAQVIGTLMILMSVIILTDRSGKFQFDRGILLGLLCGLVYGLAVTGWVYISKHSEPLTWNALTFFIPAILILLYSPKSARQMKPFLKAGVFSRLILLCILVSIGSACLLAAFSKHSASVVSPLLQTQVLLTVILAIIFLNERKNLKSKIAAAGVCIIGALLVVS